MNCRMGPVNHICETSQLQDCVTAHVDVAISAPQVPASASSRAAMSGWQQYSSSSWHHGDDRNRSTEWKSYEAEASSQWGGHSTEATMPTDAELQQHKSEFDKVLTTFGNPFRDVWVPLCTICDYVVTLRHVCGLKGSVVKWQTEALAYQKAIEVALHHLPPGHAITIENSLPVPDDYSERKSYYLDIGPDQLLYDIAHGLTSRHVPGSTQNIPLVHAHAT